MVCPKVCSKKYWGLTKMAVDRSQFINQIEAGLKANKDFTKFYISIKKNQKIIQKVIDYSNKQWDKKTRISQAKTTLLNERNKEYNNNLNFTENSPLNIIADIYFDFLPDTTWTKKRIASYNLYCRQALGKMKIKDIKKVHIDSLRKSMETKGHKKQTENGCKPRTIIQVLSKVLKPILEYALSNDVIQKIPQVEAPKIDKKDRKKKVVKASEKFVTLFKTIMTLYADDPFYRALFLFAWYGRRWNEIRTLEWSDIDFKENSYTIRDINNKIGEDQTYDLPFHINEALQNIQDNNQGAVFKSPVTGGLLHPPKKQLAKIKKIADIPELTMHYFRHILVSAMGEAGTASTVLSASLGHTNLKTVNDYYLSANHTKASQEANKAIANLTNNN